ncbi:MAG TPA: sugar ABC transporter ATP-binding protein [Acetobacteraceae bacterium]|nr:sugar ABC transporter ATP-binding protein [Acetobacteraceae bacterium]
MTSQPGEALLRAAGICKHFAGVRALVDVSLELFPGEVHGLLGANGAGKSTLINVLDGAVRPDSGSLRVSGREIALGSLSASRSAGLAVVHQELMLFPDRSVEENVIAGILPEGAFRFLSPRARRRKAETALQRLGAFLDVRARVDALPLAHRQMVEIARALCRGGSILILDEPTSALSRPEARGLFDAIRGIVAGEAAVIFVSHRLDEVFEITDTLTVLRDGRVEGRWRTADADIATITRAMVGDLADERPPERIAASEARTAISIRGSAAGLPPVDFAIGAGEVVGLAGLEGSGVSTLVQMLGGVVPVNGRVEVGGQPVRFRHPSQAIRQGIIYLPPDRKKGGLWLEHDAVFNIGAALVEKTPIGWLRRKSLAKSAASGLAQVGVRADALFEPVRRLSGGNQQRVLLGRLLQAGPRVLLLNDFTRGVDVRAKASIHRVVRDLAASGLAVCITSSDLEELLGVADRIVCMRAGRIVADGLRGQFDKLSLLATVSTAS